MSDEIKTIREYMEHKPHCMMMHPDGHRCDCGYDAALSALDQLAPTAEIVKAGDAMAVQLRHLAEEYRNTMSMRGGSSDVHPLHAEALTAWFAAKSQPPLDIPEAITAFEFIKEIGERRNPPNFQQDAIRRMVKWANHGIASLTP